MKNHTLTIPNNFNFIFRGVVDFQPVLNFFDWEGFELYESVTIDFSECESASYQAMSLIILYALYLKEKGKYVYFQHAPDNTGLSAMWRRMGAVGMFTVATKDNEYFRCRFDKQLFYLKDKESLIKALDTARTYTSQLGVEYEKTLTYVFSELFYNAREHGKSNLKLSRFVEVPSLVQFCWYANRDTIEFIVADLGIGIKKHLEQTHSQFESDIDAILESLKPNVSGTFNRNDPYTSKDNAGMGLYISNNIIRKLNSEMYIVSHSGIVHVTPMDVTSTKSNIMWPGTFVFVRIHLHRDNMINYEDMRTGIIRSAEKELVEKDAIQKDNEYYLSLLNYFGENCNLKEDAIAHRDKYLNTVAELGKILILDFENVKTSPHSFLNALLALPIRIYQRSGYNPYKKIRIIGAKSDVRETLDYILNENTD